MDISSLVDVERGIQIKRIFSDPQIFDLEMERIFERCWLFLSHESLIPEFGDFVVTRMGTDEVIVWRQRDGAIRVFHNYCTHRGARLCQAESGNARGLACGYHGWAFGVDGSLQVVPVGEEEYHEGFRCANGLREVARVESHRGFIFGCMDPEAPPLVDYLGDSAFYFDLWADAEGGVELLGPPSRSIVCANWKSPTENFIGDTGHIYWTHGSAMMGMFGRNSMPHDVAKTMGLQMTAR